MTANHPTPEELASRSITEGEWKCPKCGAQADERFDCCEAHRATSRAPAEDLAERMHEPVAWRYRVKGSSKLYNIRVSQPPEGWTETPLYGPNLLASYEEMRRERDELRLAILGGEDVPGVAATVSIPETIKALHESKSGWQQYGEEGHRRAHEISAAVEPVIALIEELCDAVDREDADIGGGRGSRRVLRDIGPAYDKARAAYEEMRRDWVEPETAERLIRTCERAQAERDTLAEDNERLRAGLRPFAEALDAFGDPGWDDMASVGHYIRTGDITITGVSLGDIRRARASLQSAAPAAGEDPRP